LEEIHQRLPQPRPSLSPSHFPRSAFKDFEWVNDRVVSEATVMRTILPIIHGTANIPSERDVLFNGLQSMTDGVTVDAEPGLYDGALPGSIDKRVKADLDHHIIPSSANLQAPEDALVWGNTVASCMGLV
jgi:hypothetical protein